MAVTTRIPPPRSLRLAAPAAAMVAIAGGILTLAGAASGLGILSRLVTGSAIVKLATAVGFILLGTALWLLRSDSPGTRRRQIASACAAGVVVISVLMLGRYLFAGGLVQWLGGYLGTFLPGLMPPTLVACFFGLAAALLVLGTGRTLWLSQGLALTTVVLALVGCVYYFGRWEHQSHLHIGAYAALIVLTLACGTFAARPDRDLMRLITSDTPGGVLVRRFLPLAIAVPIAFGWLRMEGQLLGFYDTEFGIAVSVAWFILLFSSAGLWIGSALLRSDVERRRLEEALIRGEAYFHALSDNTHDMVVIMSADGIMRYVSPSHPRVLGYRPEELIGRYPFDLMHPDDAPEALRVFEEGLRTPGNTRRLEYRFRHHDGSWRVIEAIATNLLSHPVLAGIVVTSRDVTESKDAAHRLQMYARQQAALAALSRDALMNKDLSALLDEAVHTVAETLGVDYCELLELLPDGNSLRLQAAAGWDREAVADRVVKAGGASHAGYTLLSHEPVVFEDLRSETRFTPSALLRAQGVTSGVSVVIGDRESPFDILGAYTRERRTFASDEIHFLQGLADVLAQTIDRRHAENQLRLILEQMPAILWTTDTGLRFTRTVAGALASLDKRPGEVAGLTLEQYLATDDPQDAAIVAHRRALAGAAVDYDYDWTGHRLHCHVEPLRDDTGTTIGVIGVLQDITERARAEERLRTSEALFRALVENGAEAISLWHADGTCIYLSPNHGRVFGYPSDKRLDGNWMDYVRPEDLPDCTAVFAQTVQHPGQPVTSETWIRRHDGSWVWAEVTACNLLEDPQVQAIVVNARDVTERKRAEEALRKSEERFAVAVAGANDGLWDWNFETDDQYVSPRCKEIIGFEEHELPNRMQALCSRIHPEDMERVTASFRAHLNGSTPYFGSEFRLQHKDGSYRWVVARGRVLRSPNGKPLRVAGSLTDIAARRRAEDALRESEQRFRAIADTAPAFIWMTGPDGACTWVNQRWLYFRGRTLEQEIGDGWQDAIHPDDLGSIETTHAAMREGRGYTAEVRARGGDGQYHWLLNTGMPRYTADGTFLGLVGSSVDITERKHAEEALRESEERYRTLTENAYDLISEITPGGRLLFVSRNHRDTLGYELHELAGQLIADLMHPDDRSVLGPGFRNFTQLVFRLRHKSGDWCWLEATGRIFQTAAGENRAVVISRDITARKRAEDALHESEERYRLLVELSPDPIVIHCEGKLVFMNPVGLTLLGATGPEQVIGRSALDFVHPNFHELVRGRLQQLQNGVSLPFVTLKLLRLDGSLLDAETGATSFTYQGKPAVLVVGRDLTERMRAEEALRQSEERFRAIVENAPFGYYRVGKDGLWQYVSPVWERMHGLSSEEVIGKPFEITQPPNSVGEARELVKRALAGETIVGEFGRLVREGNIEYHSFNIQPVKNCTEIVGIEGFIKDITERKEAEAALHDYAERLQVLSRRLLEVQEIERRNLARELHDEIAQSLTAVRINLQRDLATTALAPRLQDSIAVVDQAIQQVRNLSLDLRPSLLDDLGLVPALRWYVDRQAQRSGLNLQLIAEPLATKPPPEVETACFRVVQDALTNAMLHAHAQQVRIELRQQEAELHVVVHDDGIGFDVAQQRARATRGESMGLLSMEERAALLGGSLKIISAHARGTEVHACFPLKNGAL